MTGGKEFRLLLTGGGTGGHLFPAVATAQNAKGLLPDCKVLFIGTKRKLDREQLERDGFHVRTVHSYGLKGKKLPALLKALAVLPLTLCEAIYHIVRFRPSVVCGVGGYVTGPVVMAAWLLRIPTVIHEQNSVPGLANRKLGPLVDRICISLPASKTYFPVEKTVLTGNPVRRQILKKADETGTNGDIKTLLILGGSQGARSINEAVVAMVQSKHSPLAGIRLIHQTGIGDEEWVASAYREYGIEAEVASFFTDMAGVYERADLVISRAGATTLAELAVLGKPVILVPYPFAADNHQEKNGLYYVNGGGALLVKQQDGLAGKLEDVFRQLQQNPDQLDSMSKSMRAMGIGDAAERIVAICTELAQ